ncbi:MAG: GvpL/GvpF family gas vesicle protein [Vicinamibacterales bacterium]
MEWQLASDPIVMESAVYVYCAVKSARRPSTTGSPEGLPAASAPEALRLAPSIWLIVCAVPIELYGPGALEPRLRDLEWVASIAVAHESVVESFARRRALVVVPMKLFTMFSSREKAVVEIGRRRANIERSMRRIAGCEEWGIRVVRSSSAPSTDAPNGDAGGSGDSRHGAGARFLTARKNASDAAKAMRAAVLAAADRAFVRLSTVARDAAQRPRRQESGTNPPILEGAFLVPVRARTRFKTEARRQAAVCAAAGGHMTLTGPWPAYNFVVSPEESA